MKRRISFRSSKTAETRPSPLSSTTGRGVGATRSPGRWPTTDRALATHASWDWLAFPHQSRIVPEVLRAARPVFFLALLVLGVIATASFALWATRSSPEPGIDLLAEAPSPNLNTTSAEVAAPDPLPRSEPVPAVVVESAPAPMLHPEATPREPAALGTPEPPAPLDAGPGVVLIPATPPVLEDDVIAVRVSHPGDTPMISEWKLLGLQTVLAGALVAASTGPIAAADAPEKGSSDVKKDDGISTQLKELREQMKQLNESMIGLGGAIEKDVKKIREDINRLSNDVIASKDKAEKASSGVESLRSEVDRLRRELESLRTQVASGRVSNYPQAGQTATTGRVRLINTFASPVTILINNKAYEVMPGETRLSDPLPSGTINYEVLGIQAARNTRLDPNEILTINVFTR